MAKKAEPAEEAQQMDLSQLAAVIAAGQNAEADRDAREKAYMRFVEFYLNVDNILMISRISDWLQFYLWKLIVIHKYYDRFWGSVKVSKTLIAKEDWPYYEAREQIVGREQVEEEMRGTYWDMVSKFLQSTVSLNGASRDELRGIITRQDAQLEMQGLQRSWMDRFRGGGMAGGMR